MNPLLGYAHRLLNNQTTAEQALEHEVCKLGLRYRTQFLFPGQKAIVDFPDFKTQGEQYLTQLRSGVTPPR